MTTNPTKSQIQEAVDELLIYLAPNLDEKLGKALNTLLTALAEAQKEVTYLFLCETNKLCLKPNQNYRFLVGAECPACKSMEQEACCSLNPALREQKGQDK